MYERPVAIGETIIKIAGQCIVKIYLQTENQRQAYVRVSARGRGSRRARGIDPLRPLDSGPQSDIPCALLGHAQRVQIEYHSATPNGIVNTIRRADIVKQGFPELIPYFKMCYDNTSMQAPGKDGSRSAV